MKIYDYLGKIASAIFLVNFEKLLELQSIETGKKVCGMFTGSGLVFAQIG